MYTGQHLVEPTEDVKVRPGKCRGKKLPRFVTRRPHKNKLRLHRLAEFLFVFATQEELAEFQLRRQ
jgi:hypothetical protein